jgi:hypothetical protein
MHAWQFGQSFEINERFGGIVHVSRRQLEAYNNDNIQYIVQVYDTRNFIWYMDNQMEVLNLSFISFMHLNNDFSAFFVIYLPVINASMKSRPMSLTITWPPSLNRAVGRSFWLGGGVWKRGQKARGNVKCRVSETPFPGLRGRFDTILMVRVYNSVLVCRNLQFGSTKCMGEGVFN